MKKEIFYEVFVDSTYGSDVLHFTDSAKAIEGAKSWAKDIGYLQPVVVVRVEHELIFTTKNPCGKEG